MEPDTCVIKEEMDSPPCGGEVINHLTNLYTFDSGEQFEFTLVLCKEHQDALIERYSIEFAAYAN